MHALYSWTDSGGVPKMALRGDEVELSGDELERAERLGAVTEDPLPDGGATVPQPTPPVATAEAGKLLDAPAEKPARRPTAAKD